MAGSKPKSNVPLADPLETGREFVRSVGTPTKKWIADESTQSSKTFLEQLLGMNLDSKAAEPKAGKQEAPAERQFTASGIEVFDIFVSGTGVSSEANERKPAKAERKNHAEAPINYHREIAKSSEKASRNETREMSQNIEQIKLELKKLVSSSQVLKMEFAQIGVDETPKEVGQYHLNFFEWMLAVIRSAREKVEDSGAWLNTVKGKGAKKGYWGMFKKHGTTFGMSGERSVATQVG